MGIDPVGSDTAHNDRPGRLLRLLALLQSRREWSGADLARRLGVTDRTVRRDVDRLRALDYPVTSATGTAGGYRLAAGTNLPPLALDDDEAIAVATALVTATSGGLAGIEDSAMAALAKLQQVLPARLRPRLAALRGAAVAVPQRAVPQVDPGVLAVLASACRDREVLTFDYRDREGQAGSRRVEPHSLVTVRGHWYLVAYDQDRADWRTFRADRVDEPRGTHRQCAPRELPAPDAATYLTRAFACARYRYTAWMTVALPAEKVRAGVFATIPGEVTARGPGECTVRLSAESGELVVQFVAAIAALGAECTIDAPDEIARRLRELGHRMAGTPPPSRPCP